MRTLSVVCIIILFVGSALAQEQIKKNVYSLEGEIFYSSSAAKDGNSKYDESTYLLMPSISYFIVDQCELSASIGYERSTSTYSNPSLFPSSSESKSTNLSLGLGMRYYFLIGKIALFIGASGGTSWSSFLGQTFSAPQTNFRVTGGLEIFISPSAALEPAISYESYRYSDQISSSGIQIGIGIKYFIL